MEDSCWLLQPLTGSTSFFFGFQRVGFRHVRIRQSFVSVCLFIKSHTVQARRGFNRESVVLSASGRGLDIESHGDMFMRQHHLTALTLHRQTPSKESAVYPLENIGTPFCCQMYTKLMDSFLFFITKLSLISNIISATCLQYLNV